MRGSRELPRLPSTYPSRSECTAYTWQGPSKLKISGVIFLAVTAQVLMWQETLFMRNRILPSNSIMMGYYRYQVRLSETKGSGLQGWCIPKRAFEQPPPPT